MNDIRSKDYAEFLETALTDIMELPVESICIMLKLPGGATATHYYKTAMVDKLLFAGTLQQDAMMDTLKINGMMGNDNAA